jgi:hypothetical protein
MNFVRTLVITSVFATACPVGPVAVAADLDFNRDIRPILSNTCFRCHGPDPEHREAGLRLDTFEAATADESSSPAIKPGDPDGSEMIRRISSTDSDSLMPPPDSGLVLKPEQIALFGEWIRQGARYQPHWAFSPIVRPAEPQVQHGDWVRNPIDRFVRAKLEAATLPPSPPADPRTLVRRVYLDLLGLPPTLEEADAFVNDTAPDAYERLVDRVLASEHYGERWGRYWLDQARYADTNGYSIDSERSIWPYRDWVIRALNRDLPFDQFTVEQLAGDLLPNPTTKQRIASGFHRNTLVNQEGGTDAEQFRNEAVVDRVNTTGAVWLGLTVGCAQCHNHKYDPISQRDYYQLFAFFNSGQDVNSVTPTMSLPSPEQTEQLAELDQQIAAVKAEVPKAEEALKAREAERKKLAASIPTTLVMADLPKPRPTHVLVRGDFLRKGDLVQPDVPGALPGLPETPSSRTRLDLARWLVDSRNPLTARVTVNRIWMRYFGRGLVETENDFGMQGSLPTHPELLDWLAAEFMEQGWSQKRLHRLILTSATYRQSSHARPDLELLDPLNRLLARQVRLRVDAELVRDLALGASGLLNPKIGGPSVYPPQPGGVYAFTQRQAAWPTSTGPDRYRRSLYTFFMRSAPYPTLTTFDAPNFNQTCTRRARSNTPLQSLTMANDQALFELAQAFGQRLLTSPVGDDLARLQLGFRLALVRSAEPSELERLAGYLTQLRTAWADSPEDAKRFAGSAFSEGTPAAEAAAWVSVARVLMNLDEFITRE